MALKNHPSTKTELLCLIKNEWENLESLMAGLSEVQLMEPGVEVDWSIKDILAHISAWELMAQDTIHAAITGEPIKLSIPEGENWVDILNADVYETNKDVPLRDVQSEYYESHRSFLDLIDSMEDDYLPQKLPFEWAGDLTYQVLISSNTHIHYAEHAESIRKWSENINLMRNQE
jgi:hypothetical protein